MALTLVETAAIKRVGNSGAAIAVAVLPTNPGWGELADGALNIKGTSVSLANVRILCPPCGRRAIPAAYRRAVGIDLPSRP